MSMMQKRGLFIVLSVSTLILSLTVTCMVLMFPVSPPPLLSSCFMCQLML